MDLMIDCMPLYEMIEDDMKNIANLNNINHNNSNNNYNNISNLINNNSNSTINSNSASPSCLSDEEQLALTSCSIFDDLFFFTSPNTITTNTSAIASAHFNSSVHSNNNFEQLTSVKIENDFNHITNSDINCTLSLNESFNSLSSSTSSSSSSSSSSSAVCSPLSSPLSLSLSSSSLCAALASTNFSSIKNTASPQLQQSQQSWNLNQIIDSNQYCSSNNVHNNNNNYQTSDVIADEVSVSPVNTSIMQDSYLNNNFNLYHVINPMDLNRNYTSSNLNLLQSQSSSSSNENNSKNSLTILNNNNKQQSTSTHSYSHQQVKRGKYSHANNASNINNEMSNSNSPSNSNSNSNNSLQAKQEPIFNSDGESTGSNESNDSNSSYGSISINNNTTSVVKMEPFQLKNLTNTNNLGHHQQQQQQQQHQQQPQIINVNNPTQINLIKINNPKENKSSTTTLNNLISSSNSACLKLPITTAKLTSNVGQNESNQNHKTIIQYKQLLNTNLNTSLKAQQPNNSNINNNNNNSNCTNLQISNGNGLVSLPRNDANKVYPKPPYSYSCLIAMALRNSDTGNLPVSDIYDFIIENFPYYKTARDGWKNSIRHNLSLNKCFEKIENPTNGSKKGCLWALNPDKCKKLEEECKRCRQRDPINIRLSMSRPDDLNKIERGEQRIKKYPVSQSQRKIIENSSINSNGQSNASSSPVVNQSTDQLINNDSFLLEWANNKNSTFILKEEDDSDQYFDDSDIKFDSILLSSISPATIRNIV